MSFTTYLTNRLTTLLEKHQLLTVFDPRQRYRGICTALAAPGRTVVDGSDRTLLEVRREVIAHWQDLRGTADRQLLIYRTDAMPEEDEERQQDPLSAFTVMGAVFPDLTRAGDSYRDLASGAYPTLQAEIDSLFSSGEPSLAALDALATGDTWPALTAVTGHTGTVEILVTILDENAAVVQEILQDPTALDELRRFLTATLEMSEGTGGTVTDLRNTLWKRLLISEFVLDLPGDPPAQIQSVPRTSVACKQVVFQVCDRLRSAIPRQYIEHAEELVRSLQLDRLTRGTDTLGAVDTFAFENAAALRIAVRAVIGGETARATEQLERARSSIWYRQAGTLQTPWQIIVAAIEFVTRLEKGTPVPDTGELAAWYQRDGAPVDATYRAFIFTSATRDEEEPWGVPFGELEGELSARYRSWIDTVQAELVRRVETEGWPLSGLQRQDRLYSERVEPLLDGGKRVAYILVDALRFDLATALEQKLGGGFRTELTSAGALLPSKTRLCMAALGPATREPLIVEVAQGDWTVRRGNRSLKSAADRDGWFREYKGDQAAIETLDTWLKRGKNKALPDTVRLLVIRTTDIDAIGEQGSHAIFRAALEGLISDLTKGIKKALDQGFDHVVVATDHGFLYLPERKPGDEVTPPVGSGAVKHSRYAIGPVDPAEHLLCFEAAELGYTLEKGRVVLPRSLGTFGKPGFYVHGGLSLQEALVPVMTVTPQAQSVTRKAVPVSINYKGKDTGLVRTLRPSITVVAGAQGGPASLDFEEEWATRSARIRIEIVTRSEDAPTGETPAGDVAANTYLDPDTGTLVIPEGTTAPIPLRIDEGVYEEVVIRAINAETDTTWGTVTLKVDILE